jgi:hypothetical protein
VGFEAAQAAFFSHRCLDFVGRLRDFVIAVEAASFDNAVHFTYPHLIV